jgi:hypothetical protein
MFDPDKVERFSFEDDCAGCCGCTMSRNQPDGDYVDASEYDQLLQLYKVACSMIPRPDDFPDEELLPNGYTVFHRLLDPQGTRRKYTLPSLNPDPEKET